VQPAAFRSLSCCCAHVKQGFLPCFIALPQSALSFASHVSALPAAVRVKHTKSAHSFISMGRCEALCSWYCKQGLDT
jgi:hypothetical protein